MLLIVLGHSNMEGVKLYTYVVYGEINQQRRCVHYNGTEN